MRRLAVRVTDSTFAVTVTAICVNVIPRLEVTVVFASTETVVMVTTSGAALRQPSITLLGTAAAAGDTATSVTASVRENAASTRRKTRIPRKLTIRYACIIGP